MEGKFALVQAAREGTTKGVRISPAGEAAGKPGGHHQAVAQPRQVATRRHQNRPDRGSRGEPRPVRKKVRFPTSSDLGNGEIGDDEPVQGRSR